MGNPEAHPRLGAFAITFERPEVLRATLAAIAGQTLVPERVWVVDNSSNRATEEMVLGLNRSDLRYWRMGENAGPAGAAAVGLQLLRSEGYPWAYWIDDDDPPGSPDALERLMGIVARESDGSLAAVAAVGQRFSWTRGVIERLPDEMLSGVVDVDVIGGNQTFLVSTEAAHTVGYPTRALFFGCEELEFCLRLRQRGYRLLVDGELMSREREKYGRAGSLTLSRSIVPKTRPNAVWREYYDTRNYIWAMRRFGRPDLARRWAARGVVRGLASWLRGPVFGARFSGLALRGILDGYTGNMGRTVAPNQGTRGQGGNAA